MTVKFTQTDSGLIVPESKRKSPKPEAKPSVDERDGFPVKAGWVFTKCDERYRLSDDEGFRKKALEDLYIAVDPGGGWLPSGHDKEDRARWMKLVNELAVELVGGIPEGCEEYT